MWYPGLFTMQTGRHHKKLDVAESRPKYRQGRRERAVKVYTINQESKYLLVMGVPAIRVREDLIKLFALYGDIEEYQQLDDYPCEEFTEVYWIKFCSITAARIAKRKLDDHSFMGGVLHVCYAPEYETVTDTREKLNERRSTIENKLTELSEQAEELYKSASRKNAQQQLQATVHSTLPEHSKVSVLSTVAPATCLPHDYPPLPTTTMDPYPLPQTSPPSSNIPGQSADWYPYLPPPPGTQQYSTMYYQSMDPLDPELPAPSQPKKLKVSETNQTAVSQPELPLRIHNRVGAQTVTQPCREVLVCPVSAEPFEKQLRIGAQTTRPNRESLVCPVSAQKHHGEQFGLSATDSSDLGFFSTPTSDKQVVHGPLYPPLLKVSIPPAPQMGSASLDVSARSIREKMTQLGQPSTYGVVDMQWPLCTVKDNEGKHNQKSVSSKNASKPSLKKQKDDKRKRI